MALKLSEKKRRAELSVNDLLLQSIKKLEKANSTHLVIPGKDEWNRIDFNYIHFNLTIDPGQVQYATLQLPRPLTPLSIFSQLITDELIQKVINPFKVGDIINWKKICHPYYCKYEKGFDSLYIFNWKG